MLKAILLFTIGIVFVLFLTHSPNDSKSLSTKNVSYPDSLKNKDSQMENKVIKSDEEWKKELSPEAYQILRQKATERAFTGKYWNNFEYGTYVCAGCGTPLFESDTKFESSCGWPSYFEPIDSSRIIYKEDRSHGMIRTEVLCAKCGGHLGHIFDDGPPPTGKRYCINSGAMKFIPKNK